MPLEPPKRLEKCWEKGQKGASKAVTTQSRKGSAASLASVDPFFAVEDHIE